MSLERVLSEVRQERAMQDSLWGGPAHDDLHTPAGWMAVLCRHLGLAADDAGGIDPARFRRQMVRVAALAVAAVESRDRVTGRPTAVVDCRSGDGVPNRGG
jgi:hypothetical protein